MIVSLPVLSLPHVRTPTLSVVILYVIYYFAAKSVNGSLFQLHDPISYVSTGL